MTFDRYINQLNEIEQLINNKIERARMRDNFIENIGKGPRRNSPLSRMIEAQKG